MIVLQSDKSFLILKTQTVSSGSIYHATSRKSTASFRFQVFYGDNLSLIKAIDAPADFFSVEGPLQSYGRLGARGE